MKLSKQVVSIELSKRLKELGINLPSFFAHFINTLTYEMKWEVNKQIGNVGLPAFTVAELGEFLPPSTSSLTYWIMKIDSNNPSSQWQAELLMNNKSLCIFQDETEANIRAKMLIYLIENKLMDIPQ